MPCAFQNVNNAQGMAQPYINQAQQLFSPQGAQSFFNPAVDAVTAQMQNVFGQQNQQNNANLVQSAGGVGADRIAVGQGNLANQQGLAAGQTYSNLWNSAVQQAQGAGYGTAALGSQAQNAALQGAQAQLGTGGLQQQLSQAQLNSPYQQQLAQAAFPYQQAQFLAGITGSLAPALGGTTTGQGTTTSPSPSMFSQLLGLGTAGLGAAGGAGAFGGSPSYGGGSALKGDAYGGSGSSPLPGLTSADYGAGFARGGYAEGGSPMFGLPEGLNDKPINVDQQSIIPQEQLAPAQVHMPNLNLNPPAGGGSKSGSGDAAAVAGDVMKIAGMFLKRGGMVNPKFAGGGASDDDPFVDQAWPVGPVGGPTDTMRGYDKLGQEMRAQRGIVDPQIDQPWPTGMKGGPSDESSSVNPGDPVRMPGDAAMKEWAEGADRDRAMGLTAQPGNAPAAAAAEAAANPSRSLSAPAADQAPALAPGTYRDAIAPHDKEEDSSTKFAKSPWMALMAAGLGIAGGTSPFAAVNIGQGGLMGLKALEQQRGEAQKDETIAQASRRLDLEAKHHEDQYSRATPYQQFEMKKPVPMGQRVDPLTGMPMTTYGSLQPDGSFKPVDASGKPIDDPGALPPTSSPTQGWLPGKNVPDNVNPAALAQVDEGTANMVRAIDEGRAKLSDVPMRQRFMVDRLLHAYDKGFDGTVWNLRNKQYGDLSTNGTAGKMLTATNQLLPHLATSYDKAMALANTNYPAANTIKNWWLTQTGDPRTKEFATVREVAAMDAARLLRGTGQMAEKDIEEWRKNIADQGSPAQLAGVIKLLGDDLIGARITSLQHAYRQNMRQEPPEFLSPEAKSALERIRGGGGGAAQTAPAAAPAGGAPAAAAPPQVGDVKTNAHGVKGRWNGTGWEIIQ